MTEFRPSIFEQAAESARRRRWEDHPYYLFEPWDVRERPQWILDLARKDGLDLHDAEFVRVYGRDPHPFQTGFITSTAHMNIIIGGNQIGKSVAAAVRLLCMLTGEIPFSLRKDTPAVARQVTPENVKRFGRFDSATGRKLDHKWREPSEDWNCGLVGHCGEFPLDLVAPPHEHVWVVAHEKHIKERWWPLFERREFIPPHVLDTSQGVDGYGRKDRIIYFRGDRRLSFFTYEQGHRKLESLMAWTIWLDEEPPDESFLSAALSHSRKGIMLSFTPYLGLTYTYELIRRGLVEGDCAVFHATQYDCPYLDLHWITRERKGMQAWQVPARVWGIHSEQQGAPYFDRDKLNRWIGAWRPDQVKYAVLEPVGKYSTVGVTGLGGSLLETYVVPRFVNDADERRVWEIYETPDPDAAYLITVDAAQGAEVAKEAGDFSAALVFRRGEGNEPVIVAAIRSTVPVAEFARVILHAARYYNNAVICPESPNRGAANAAFYLEIRDWPFIYRSTVTSDATDKLRKVPGLDTTTRMRSNYFELIRNWIAEREEKSGIPCLALLKELAECIVGKGGRPDHRKRAGTLDLAVCFGMGLWVFKENPEAVMNNAAPRRVNPAGRPPLWCPRESMLEETGPLGLGAMGYGRN